MLSDRELLIAVISGFALLIISLFIQHVKTRLTDIANFKDIIHSLAVIFGDKCKKLPVSEQIFLEELYRTQLPAMLRAKHGLLNRARRDTLQKIWDNYYHYIVSGTLTFILEKDSQTFRDGWFTGQIKEDIQSEIEELGFILNWRFWYFSHIYEWYLKRKKVH